MLDGVQVRPIESGERERHDQFMVQEHYLGNAHLVGEQLPYVAKYQGQWVALRCKVCLGQRDLAAFAANRTFATGGGDGAEVVENRCSGLKGLHQDQSSTSSPLAVICGGDCGGNGQPNCARSSF